MEVFAVKGGYCMFAYNDSIIPILFPFKKFRGPSIAWQKRNTTPLFDPLKKTNSRNGV